MRRRSKQLTGKWALTWKQRMTRTLRMTRYSNSPTSTSISWRNYHIQMWQSHTAASDWEHCTIKFKVLGYRWLHRVEAESKLQVKAIPRTRSSWSSSTMARRWSIGPIKTVSSVEGFQSINTHAFSCSLQSKLLESNPESSQWAIDQHDFDRSEKARH